MTCLADVILFLTGPVRIWIIVCIKNTNELMSLRIFTPQHRIRHILWYIEESSIVGILCMVGSTYGDEQIFINEKKKKNIFYLVRVLYLPSF